MSHRILITGGTGLLGQALLKIAPHDAQLSGTYLPGKAPTSTMPCPFFPLDVRDTSQVKQIFDQVKPTLVIHTASIGSVDYSESHREESWAVNVGGTQNVIAECLRYNAKLIFISSNAVFDGNHPLYAEAAPVHPINYYGQLKIEGEQCVQTSGLECAIVRPILMYGWHLPIERGNWVTAWIKLLGEDKRVQVVDDVKSKPLYSINCAQAIWAIIEKNKTGLYHIAGADHVTLFDLAKCTAEIFGLNASLIESVPSSYFPEIAPRPRDTSFDTTKMETDLDVRAWSVREGLLDMLAQRTV